MHSICVCIPGVHGMCAVYLGIVREMLGNFTLYGIGHHVINCNDSLMYFAKLPQRMDVTFVKSNDRKWKLASTWVMKNYTSNFWSQILMSAWVPLPSLAIKCIVTDVKACNPVICHGHMLLFCCSNMWVVSYVGWNCVTWTPECLEEAANYTANSAGDQLFPDVLSYVVHHVHWSCTHRSRRPHVAYDGIVCGCPKPWAMTYYGRPA